MRKFLSILLCLCFLFGIFIPAVQAEQSEDPSDYPTVMVAGYSSSNLFLQSESGDQKIWGVDFQQIGQKVLQNIARIGRGLGELAFGHPEYISSIVGESLLDLYGVMSYSVNGESLYPIFPYAQNAVTKAYDILSTQHRYLNEYFNGENIHEREISASLAEVIYGEDGDRYFYSFQTDFRQNVIDIAADLDRFIDSIREETGSQKVNIYAVSHGGEISAVYLNIYGEKHAVCTAVLTVPAIGGAALAYDVLSENVRLDEETLLYFIENGNMIEQDINWLVRANRLGVLDDVCNLLIHNYVRQLLGYWGSIWDFVPGEYYDELKARFLNAEENAALIEKSDIYHYEILPSMTEKLQACVDAGTNIYIVAGTENPSVTGLQEQSDAIITVSAATGAYTAPYGTRFNDGYIQKNTVCTDLSHNHLSPSMTIDASTGYLPEQTWYVGGLFHGMTWKDPYAKALCCMLISADHPVTVHSDRSFPQFKYAENNSYSVLAAFNTSEEGYLCEQDSSVLIKNLSQKYKMRLISIACDGAELQFNLTRPTYLSPGETKEIQLKGTIPATSLSTVDLTVTYALIGNITPIGTRTLTFTLQNGDPIPYDEENPFVTAKRLTYYDQKVAGLSKRQLPSSAVLDWIKLVLNAMISILRMFKAYSVR